MSWRRWGADHWQAVAAVVMAIAALVGVYYLVLDHQPKSDRPRPKTTVHISDPTPGQLVDRCIYVTFTANMPTDERLWAVVDTDPVTTDTDRALYVGSRALPVRGNPSAWTATAHIGAAGREGEADWDHPFTVMAVTTTGEATKRFQLLDDAGVEPLIGDELPNGAVERDHIVVTRKRTDRCPIVDR